MQKLYYKDSKMRHLAMHFAPARARTAREYKGPGSNKFYQAIGAERDVASLEDALRTELPQRIALELEPLRQAGMIPDDFFSAYGTAPYRLLQIENVACLLGKLSGFAQGRRGRRQFIWHTAEHRTRVVVTIERDDGLLHPFSANMECSKAMLAQIELHARVLHDKFASQPGICSPDMQPASTFASCAPSVKRASISTSVQRTSTSNSPPAPSGKRALSSRDDLVRVGSVVKVYYEGDDLWCAFIIYHAFYEMKYVIWPPHALELRNRDAGSKVRSRRRACCRGRPRCST